MGPTDMEPIASLLSKEYQEEQLYKKAKQKKEKESEWDHVVRCEHDERKNKCKECAGLHKKIVEKEVPNTNVPWKVKRTINDESRIVYLAILNEDWVRYPESSDSTLKAGVPGLVDFYWPKGAPLKLVNRHLKGVKEFANELKGVPCIGEYDDYYTVHRFFPLSKVRSLKRVVLVNKEIHEYGLGETLEVIKEGTR